jgi:hypothetical protein
MKKGLTVALVVIFISTIFILQPVKAESKTMIVPDDFATLADAVNAASNGDIIFLREGNYEGPINQTLTINKTLHLIGQGKETTIIHLNPALIPKNIFTYEYMGYDDAIRIQANDVKFEGLSVNALGGNIAVYGNGLGIFNCNLSVGLTVNGDGSQIAGNTVNGYLISTEGNNHAVVQNNIVGRVETKGCFNLIANNVVNSNGLDGTVSFVGNDTVVFNNTLTGSEDWIALNLEYGGKNNLVAKNHVVSGGVEVGAYSSNNTFCGNRLDGWGLSMMGFNNLFYANQLNHIGIGGTHGGTVDAAYNTFYHNNFIADSYAFQVYTRQPASITWDNGYEGNYWVNYTGNGITPQEIYAEYHYFDGAMRDDNPVSLGQDNYPLLSPFNIESVNVQLPEWAEQSLQNTLQLSGLTTTVPVKQNSEPNTIQSLSLPLAAITITVALAFVVGLLVYFRRIKHRLDPVAVKALTSLQL